MRSVARFILIATCFVGAAAGCARNVGSPPAASAPPPIPIHDATDARAKPAVKILIVLSSEDRITVRAERAGTATLAHPTGFFLSELMVPVKMLVDEGYKPVFASPRGTKPVVDAISDGAYWFGGDEDAYAVHRQLCTTLGLCGAKGETVGSLKTLALADVLEGGLDGYAAVFVPGGHAPMEDLYRDPSLGRVLGAFHATKRPTALICHGPIALLSTLSDPKAYGDALAELARVQSDERKHGARIAQLRESLGALSKGWPYAGYNATVFSTKEEQQEEPGGADGALGGYVRFYPDEALDLAGGRTVVRAQKWQSHVVRDRELITGENPASDREFGQALVAAIKSREVGSR